MRIGDVRLYRRVETKGVVNDLNLTLMTKKKMEMKNK